MNWLERAGAELELLEQRLRNLRAKSGALESRIDKIEQRSHLEFLDNIVTQSENTGAAVERERIVKILVDFWDSTTIGCTACWNLGQQQDLYGKIRNGEWPNA